MELPEHDVVGEHLEPRPRRGVGEGTLADPAGPSEQQGGPVAHHGRGVYGLPVEPSVGHSPEDH